MKTIDLRAEVVKTVQRHWPRLVATEMMKLVNKPIATKPRSVYQYMPPKKPELAPTPKPVSSVVNYANALIEHGSRVKAAKALGIAETTFRDRLKREAEGKKPSRQDNASGPGN